MKKLFALCSLLFALCSCTGNIGANQYETSAAGQVNNVQEGVIINVRTVAVSSTDGVVGKLAGGLAGGLAGSTIGGGTGSSIAAVGGAVLGGVIGGAAQEGLSKQTAYEYIVKLDSGRAITLTQGTDVQLSVGQPVYVLDANRGDRARIIPR
jgi:outer membrane lipoprotein SlyB